MNDELSWLHDGASTFNMGLIKALSDICQKKLWKVTEISAELLVGTYPIRVIALG
jgi:hypothetical protein